MRTLPGFFVAQGELYGSSSVADVVEVSCEPVYARAHLRVSATELYDRCDQRLSWYQPYPSSSVTTGPTASVQLDNDGNAIVAFVGGPSCAAGESLISAHMEAAPYTTATTAFEVLAPQDGPPGLRVSPETEVEGETYGDVATIVQVSFAPVFAEEPVMINASQLYSALPAGAAARVGDDGRRTRPGRLGRGSRWPSPKSKKRRCASTTTATPSPCCWAAARVRPVRA